MLPEFLMLPEQLLGFWRIQEQREAQQKAYFEKHLVPKARCFDADKITEDTCFKADSFVPELVFDTDTAPAAFPVSRILETDRVYHPGKGEAVLVYRNALWPRGRCLSTPGRGRRSVNVFFDGDVITPVLYEHYPKGQGWGAWDVWMSITPMEIYTQSPAIRRARGRVVVAGLGLGWLLRRVAEKPEVKSIVVVELSKPLLDWYGYELCESVARANKKKIHVVCDDFYAYARSTGLKTCDIALVDIWKEFYDAKYDTALRELREDHAKKIWYWGVRQRKDDPF